MVGRYTYSFGLVSRRLMRVEIGMLTCDRDREWQKWPVTIVTGAYIGYAIGKLLGGTLLKGKKIMFE